jgi:murein L,D-transpeptidase YcbB/YkuD
VYNPNLNLTLDKYADMSVGAYKLNSHRIKEQIGMLIKEDTDSMMADYRTRSYYLRRGAFLWIDRLGIDDRADTLLTYISQVDKLGFSKSKFRVQQIQSDLKRMRTLDFDTAHNNINKVMARLEYNLTKAYLRYVTGQRFGYFNPRYIFNKLDVHDSDSVRVSYRGLYDVSMQRAGSSFYKKAFRKVSNDSVSEFLKEIQPQSPMYKELLALLNNPQTKSSEKPKIMVNMERCRWRLRDYPQQHRKYVLVNIPSFKLMAVDDDEVLKMRIGCGSFETKTPLLTSNITRMDINPQWIIPRSIIDKSIIQHVGDTNYFSTNHYFVRERKTGKTVDIWRVTWSMLKSPDYLVIQEGGIGNSLGRIIFRFDNSFSVYLHDTSSKGVFAMEDRGVSHGCVRVEKPFDLAVFLLKDKDKDIIHKINYSMNADVSSLKDKQNKDEEMPDTLDHSLIIGSVPVDPQVPIFITYFTIYPDEKGKLQEFDDVYGYDKVIYQYFANYK